MNAPTTPAAALQRPSEQLAGSTRPARARLRRPEWYKDAVIYQLHVKAFQDADGDGLGDFAGLIERLDYIAQLGVDTIWVLPFYPSPLRDDGYDIAEYTSINPSYGKMADFKRFVREAHRRDLNVITELVINHTSDQHPWFQRARKAKRGSAARDFYVWSDSDERYPGTRIIFIDTERSNWTWDPEAGQFFWHRFFSHQPDLNFDNPRVFDEIIKVMRFWLDLGVDGLRLDAIPYLVEREGTNNENLPETHDVLRRIRAVLDREYPDRMLLAEANQWPEDTRPYFGSGDECHMAFHFPLMPRMYMAVAQEDRHPVTDILRQTPEIPPNCQWAIFLRNHDELTLEMVTDKERDYLWQTYASDARARINLGIRRRLAPLLQNDRRKIELMNALLLSMPGTPVLYYGDELGMGDNIYLGDRDGVRTPMQWSPDRNGGFSRANPQQLYLPTVMDPIYGFQAVNVESQQGDPSSLLNWLRRMIAVRKQHAAFSRGELKLLYPRNRTVLAYLRILGEETILCLANLARTAQAVELDLSEFRGHVPVEMTGRSPFPPIGDLPYLLTLPAHGFFWFLLAPKADMPSWHSPTPDPLPDFITLTTPRSDLGAVFGGRERQQLTRDALPDFLKRQRWFGAKGETVRSMEIGELASLGGGAFRISTVDVATESGEQHRYLLPLSALWGEENLQFGAPRLSYTVAKVRAGPRLGALIDAVRDEGFAAALLDGMRTNAEVPADGGRLVFHGTDAIPAAQDLEAARPLAVEQSNVSIAFGQSVLLKVYRRLRSGEQPEIEVARFLTEQAGYRNTPAYLGSVEHRPDGGEPTTLAAAFAFVLNQGDAWSAMLMALDRELEAVALAANSPEALRPAAGDPATLGHPLNLSETLGRRTGELHAALAIDTDDPAFAVEPVTPADIREWTKDAEAQATAAFAGLDRARAGIGANARDLIDLLLAQREQALAAIHVDPETAAAGGKSRIHGDYHLGQVLVTQNDFMLIDFEGEPRRGIEERRAKGSALRDVAGMLRSFDYAAWTALDTLADRLPDVAAGAGTLAFAWRDHATRAFLDGWRSGAADARNRPLDPGAEARLLRLFLLQKAFYEINYELANRPDRVAIPIRGVLDLLREDTP